MKTLSLILLVGLASCGPRGVRPVASEDVTSLEGQASEVFHLKLPPRPASSVKQNVVSLTGGGITLSRRTDSRTWFVRNSDYGVGVDGGVFVGADEQLTNIAARIFAGLKLDPGELATQRVLHVIRGAAQYDEASGQVKDEAIEPQERVLVGTRRVGGIPVFSSRLFLGLTASGEIGRLKLHWPDIPAFVLAEARRYQQLVRDGFKPPLAANEKIASIEAGIIHSSPRGQLLEIFPIIRVIYADNGLGKPKVLYLNSAGQTLRARHNDHPAPVRQRRRA